MLERIPPRSATLRQGEEIQTNMNDKCSKSIRCTLALFLVLFSAVAGCQQKLSTEPPEIHPDEVLRAMVRAYRQASSYEDRGHIKLSVLQNGQLMHDTAPFSIRYQQPNRLKMRAYQMVLSSDGSRMRARYNDPSSPELASQMVDVEVPPQLLLQSLQFDPFIWDQLEGSAGGIPIQLRLLLNDNPLPEIFEDGVEHTYRGNREIEGHACHGIQVSAEGGNVVFWIDAKTHVLRQFEHPSQNGISIVSVLAGAQLDASLTGDDFLISSPAEGKTVRYFVVPPQPLPTSLLGKSPGRFKLQDANDASVTPETLAGQHVVLIWFNDHPSSQQAIRQLSDLRSQFQSETKITFLGVWAEGDNITDERLEALLTDWGVQVPVLRDIQAHGKSVFKIPVAPTTVVLDPQGHVQLFEIGMNSKFSDQLPGIVDRLLQGADLAQEIVGKYIEETRNYRQQLVVASSDVPRPTYNISRATILTKAPPRHFSLTPLWEYNEVTSPGNVYFFDQRSPSTVLLHDGPRRVVELDKSGKLVARHELQLPPGGGVTYLDFSQLADGRHIYAGSMPSGTKAFVFDENWKTTLVYPETAQKRDGIQDLELVDLDGDHHPEMCIGFWGTAGVRAVSLEGTLLWRSRATRSVLSLAVHGGSVAEANRLLVTDHRGRVFPIRFDGRPELELRTPGEAIYHLATQKNPHRKPPSYCGLAYDLEAGHVAIGMDSNLQEKWRIRLPGGMHQGPIQLVRSATASLLGEQSWWIIPGADGSIWFISEDGTFRDSFQFGMALRGLELTSWNNDTVLLVSTANGVSAWKLNFRKDLQALRVVK